MADTTPISNAMNIALAIKLGDPAATGADNGVTASTDATDFSAAQRNQALSFAYNELANRLIKIYGKDAGKVCEGLVATQAITFSASGVALNKDYVATLTLLKSDNSEFGYTSLKALKQDLDPYLDAGYTIENALIYAYQRTAGTLTILSSGTGTLYYIKSDRKSTTTAADVAVNTSPDTTIDVTWHNFLIDYGAYWLCLNKASGEFIEKAPIYLAQADARLPK